MNDDQTLTAIGYCRVSTDEQGERGYGLAAQREAIAAEAARQGWELLEVYVDVASGKSTRRRPQLAAAGELGPPAGHTSWSSRSSTGCPGRSSTSPS